MKRNSSLAKIFLAAIFFQSNFAAAQNYGQQTNNEVNTAAELQPLVCKKVPSPYWNSESGTEAPLVDDPACVSENNRRASVRAAASRVQSTTSRVSAGDGTALVAPKAPEYTCGAEDPYSSAYLSCKSKYDSAYSVYRNDLAAYNEAQKHIQDGTAAGQQSAMAQVKSKTAAETLAEIKDKNDQGKKSYDSTANVTMALGIAATARGAFCSGQCSMAGGGCCAQAPYWYMTAAAMFLLNSKAKKQSAEHAQSSQNACASMNQLSSSPTDCGKTSTGEPITTVGKPVVIDGATGNCTPADSDACKQAPKIGVVTGSVKDTKGINAFASGNPNDLFKLQPDGSIKLKNGKTYKESDFKDANAMMAAGLNASSAKALMDMLNGGSGNSGLSKLATDIKDTKKEKASGIGSPIAADGATTIVDTSKGVTSDKKFTDELGEKKDVKFSEDRKPSSEGLAKEFNGELIGVAADDIFLMMNRRYKLKSEQDSFIAQDLK